MRRVCGPLTLLLAVSWMTGATARAQAPPGRVVNPQATGSIKKAAPSTPARPAPARPAPDRPAPDRPAPARPAPSPDPAEADLRAISEAPDELLQEGEELAEITTGDVKRTYEQTQVTEEEKRRAAVAQQQAMAEEQQMAGRVRGLQQLIEREEQLLVQRMTYASKLREKGLTTNDQPLLDQAERYERAALTEYQKKVRQFESMSVAPASPDRASREAAPARPANAAPKGNANAAPKGNASASRPQPRR